MTDLFDDDDLFAPRPTQPARPVPAPPQIDLPHFLRPHATGFVGPRWPVAALACPCGAQDEVKEPCPDRLDCWQCHGLETMARRVPTYLPPRTGGRPLTAHELRGLTLDARPAP